MNTRFVAALVLGTIAALGATVWAVAGQDGLRTEELLRVESPTDSSRPIDQRVNSMFETLGGQRQWTDESFAEAFSESFASVTEAADLNSGLEPIHAEFGHISFVRTIEGGDQAVEVLAVSESGTPFELLVILSDDHRMQTMGLDVLDSGSRLEGWASVLAVIAGWLFLAVAASAHRSDANRTPWSLLLGAAASMSGVLILSDSGFVYTLGRALPATVVSVAVWILIGRTASKAANWLLTTAVIASIVGVLAPFVRDSALIGHPEIVGAFVNDDSAYRAFLAASAGLAAVATAGVAIVTMRELDALTRWRRTPRIVAVAIAAVWTCGAAGSAIDYAVGDGTIANGLLGACVLAAFAAVPLVVAFEFASEQWDSPELVSPVIDLDADRRELQPAARRALDDPTLQVLSSHDGELLLDDRRTPVDIDQLPPGRTVTQIRSRGKLVGALVRDATLQRRAADVSSVAAAAGLALEVQRLDRQVLAQLDDVKASRARIVHASDAARHGIERDLHDGAQQRLVALGLSLQRARRASSAAGNHEEAELFERTTGEIREILDDIRSVAHGSRPALLAERGLAPAIDALAERAPVPVRIDVGPEPLPEKAATTVYFVVAEALTNIAKHASADSASVEVSRCDGLARVRISDDGHGGAVVAPGSGLQGLDDRVAAAGGSFAIRSDQDGTTLEASIPCG